MTYSEASKKFSEVLEFLKERNEVPSSYASAVNALANSLKVKATVEQAKNKK